MTFLYTLFDGENEGTRLSVNVDKTEFLGNGCGRAIVTPYYRNKGTNNEWRRGRTCKKAVFKYNRSHSILWDGLHVNLGRPDVASSLDIKNFDIYKLPREVILATILFSSGRYLLKEPVVVEIDCPICYKGKVVYERIPFEARDIFNGKYNGKIVLKGDSNYIDADFTIELPPEELINFVVSRTYRVYSSWHYQRLPIRTYPKKSIRGFLFG